MPLRRLAGSPATGMSAAAARASEAVSSRRVSGTRSEPASHAERGADESARGGSLDQGDGAAVGAQIRRLAPPTETPTD